PRGGHAPLLRRLRPLHGLRSAVLAGRARRSPREDRRGGGAPGGVRPGQRTGARPGGRAQWRELVDIDLVVVGAAIVCGGRLLSAQRAEPPEWAGGWELPGGKVDPGESDEDALVREIYEELAVK